MIDNAFITVRSGRGGAGSFSYRREKFAPKGGPDGGDGGVGGDVYVVASLHKNTLRDFQSTKQFAAEDGGRGGKRLSHGKNGGDLTIELPLGTVIWEILNEEEYRAGAEPEKRLLAEVVHPDTKILLARGGAGGRGNVHFKNSTNRTPLEYEEGGEPQYKALFLELKLLADVGFVGFPNAGKSTLLSVLTKARPEIADYPFTTLTPHLGVMEVVWDHAPVRVVLADIPGLVEEASSGKGLGHQFLRHIERCRVFLYVLAADTAQVLGDEYAGEEGANRLASELVEQWRILERELRVYNESLAERPFLIGLNKQDILSEEMVAAVSARFMEVTGQKPVVFSAATQTGLDDLRLKIVSLLSQHPVEVGPTEAVTEFGPHLKRPRPTLVRRDKV